MRLASWLINQLCRNVSVVPLNLFIETHRIPSGCHLKILYRAHRRKPIVYYLNVIGHSVFSVAESGQPWCKDSPLSFVSQLLNQYYSMLWLTVSAEGRWQGGDYDKACAASLSPCPASSPPLSYFPFNWDQLAPLTRIESVIAEAGFQQFHRKEPKSNT